MTIIFFDITGIEIEPYRRKKDIQTDIVDYIKPRTTIKLSRKKIIFVQKLNTPVLVHCFNFSFFFSISKCSSWFKRIVETLRRRKVVSLNLGFSYNTQVFSLIERWIDRQMERYNI